MRREEFHHNFEQCKKCQSHNSSVIDSRIRSSPIKARYRRIKCNSCNYRWNTWEVSEELMLFLQFSSKIIDNIKEVQYWANNTISKFNTYQSKMKDSGMDINTLAKLKKELKKSNEKETWKL